MPLNATIAKTLFQSLEIYRGLNIYRSGVRIEKIAKIFGHADTRTTIRYLGLDFEDMDEAMVQYSQYQNSLIVPQMVQNSESQIKSGQGGI